MLMLMLVFKATPDVDHPPFIHATDFCLADTTLHENPNLGQHIDIVAMCYYVIAPFMIKGRLFNRQLN